MGKGRQKVDKKGIKGWLRVLVETKIDWNKDLRYWKVAKTNWNLFIWNFYFKEKRQDDNDCRVRGWYNYL